MEIPCLAATRTTCEMRSETKVKLSVFVFQLPGCMGRNVRVLSNISIGGISSGGISKPKKGESRVYKIYQRNTVAISCLPYACYTTRSTNLISIL